MHPVRSAAMLEKTGLIATRVACACLGGTTAA